MHPNSISPDTLRKQLADQSVEQLAHFESWRDRRRRLRRLRVEGEFPASGEELTGWARETLAPAKPLRRLTRLAIAVVACALLVGWPLLAAIGADVGFDGVLLCAVVVIAAAAPLALIGERDKARDVLKTLERGPADG